MMSVRAVILSKEQRGSVGYPDSLGHRRGVAQNTVLKITFLSLSLPLI